MRDLSPAARIESGRAPQADEEKRATMDSEVSSEAHFPDHDFDPDKLSLRLRVTMAADRKAVDPVVAQVMASVREMKCVERQGRGH